MRSRLPALGVLGLTLFCGVLLSFDVGPDPESGDSNLFQFVRIRYNGFGGGFGMERWGPPPWMHDYPRAEKNFLKILMEVTTVPTSVDSYVILDLDDPAIMEYPFLYVSEPGYWSPTPKEIQNLREYFARGGFVVFDDFRGSTEWSNLAKAMRLVNPERNFELLSLSDPVFHCFYDIESLDVIPPYQLPGMGQPRFFGWSDEKGRIQAVANFNNDIGDYWEWSDEAINPLNSNEAYKFGINYVIYSLTH